MFRHNITFLDTLFVKMSAAEIILLSQYTVIISNIVLVNNTEFSKKFQNAVFLGIFHHYGVTLLWLCYDSSQFDVNISQIIHTKFKSQYDTKYNLKDDQNL